jgi:hypothetical protein
MRLQRPSWLKSSKGSLDPRLLPRASLHTPARRSLNQEDVHWTIDGVHSLGLAVVKWAIETYGSEALPVVHAYDRKTPAVRCKISPYVRKLGKDAAPILLDALVYPGTPEQPADAEYVLGVLKLLTPEELAPERERLLRHFASAPKSVREALGDRREPKPAFLRNVCAYSCVSYATCQPAAG